MRCCFGGPRRLLTTALSLTALLLLAVGETPAQEPTPEWIRIDYAELVDRRELTHSGEAVGLVLDRLSARANREGVERDLALLDPHLELYGFVMADALDQQRAERRAPLIEVGWQWEPGEAGPAWVELLRSRHLVLHSDGQGSLRAILPFVDGAELPDKAEVGARMAWERWWPLLRHILAAEARRLSAPGRTPALELEIHAYRHDLAKTEFVVGAPPLEVRVSDFGPDGRRPALEFGALERFVASGLTLEGAAIEGGRLRLLGSQRGQAPRLGERPLSLSDFAVAYRAVFHGGRAEPYMSLDRSLAPHRSVVNYGGRLRDTALGLVAVQCDIRFKTFSLGIDPLTRRDVRDAVRTRVPEFLSHVERFSADARSQDILSQQTRLWFYPDAVDVVVAPQGDVLAMRRMRMTAASERVDEASWRASGADDPPWTRALIAELNRDYDALALVFPELDGLDHSVRLLALFSWLRMLSDGGVLLPELEALLAVELPELRTPRTFPQLLAFNALPGAATASGVDVFERSDVVTALDRLLPRGGRMPDAREAFGMAISGLDPRDPRHAALRAELEKIDPAEVSPAELDLLSYRARRLRMHRLVLTTLPRVPLEGLLAREEAGETLRVFSIGIGGLDLSMEKVLRRARGQRLSLSLGGRAAVVASRGRAGERAASPRPRAARSARDTNQAWRKDDPGLPTPRMRAPRTDAFVEDAGGALAVVLPSSPDVRAVRHVRGPDGRLERFVRVEGPRRLSYAFRPEGSRLVAAFEAWPDAPRNGRPGVVTAGTRVAVATVEKAAAGGGGGAGDVLLVVHGAGESAQSFSLPELMLERFFVGDLADRSKRGRGPAFPRLLEAIGDAPTLLLLDAPQASETPWRRRRPLPGALNDPVRLAEVFGNWWRAAASARPAVAVATDAARSAARWESAPETVRRISVFAPEGSLKALPSSARRALSDAARAAWSTTLAEDPGELVLLVSAEPPARLSRRIEDLSRDPRLKGRLLGVIALSGELREDLPARVLGEDSVLAGLGIVSREPLDLGGLDDALRRLVAAAGTGRAERLPGPMAWYF